MKKLIEAVCIGNNGRSPPAEAVAKRYLKVIGKDNEYDAISSGTRVSCTETGGRAIEYMRPYIELALVRGDVFNRQEKSDLEQALAANDPQAVGVHFSKLVQAFIAEERNYRAEACTKYGLEGVKEARDQTVVNPNVVAIMTMDKKALEGVQQIYKDATHQPIIAVVSNLAGSQYDEIQNSFGRGKQAYFNSFEQILQEVPKAIDNILARTN